jgi:hypothetical protein
MWDGSLPIDHYRYGNIYEHHKRHIRGEPDAPMVIPGAYSYVPGCVIKQRCRIGPHYPCAQIHPQMLCMRCLCSHYLSSPGECWRDEWHRRRPCGHCRKHPHLALTVSTPRADRAAVPVALWQRLKCQVGSSPSQRMPHARLGMRHL